jgi:hypothetical protein
MYPHGPGLASNFCGGTPIHTALGIDVCDPRQFYLLWHDEISMVSFTLLNTINQQCNRIRAVGQDSTAVLGALPIVVSHRSRPNRSGKHKHRRILEPPLDSWSGSALPTSLSSTSRWGKPPIRSSAPSFAAPGKGPSVRPASKPWTPTWCSPSRTTMVLTVCVSIIVAITSTGSRAEILRRPLIKAGRTSMSSRPHTREPRRSTTGFGSMTS